MKKLCLIQTCYNRKKALGRFIESLNKQRGIDLSEIQYVFVDQGNNEECFRSISPQISLCYLKKSRMSLSMARNIGLHYVDAEYVGFPDDDCWYKSDTLSNVLKVLERGDYDGVSGIGVNEHNCRTSRFPSKAAIITPTNSYAAISYTMFYRFEPSVFFDENMGIGSPFGLGAGEETDYMLTLMERHAFRIKYDPSIIVHHPLQTDTYSKDYILKKSYSYARGDGYLMQKHHFPFGYYFRQFTRPIGGMIVYLLKCDFYKVQRSFYIFKGRIEGYNYNCDKKNQN